MNESQNQPDNSDGEFDGLTIEKVEQLKRSQLQIKSTSDWLKSRHSKNVKMRYLFFPEDIKRQLEIKNIFQNFDRDHSNALDQSEMYEMFQNNGFKISEQDLKRFFLVVDEDKDNALNWQEFKKTAFNEKAGQVFTSIMRKIRKQEENQEDNGEDPKFLPMSFGSMISYLSFCTSREELKGSIEDSSLSQFERFKKYQEMFQLTNQYSKKTNNKNSMSDVSQIIELDQEDDQLKTEKLFVQQTNKKLREGLKQLEEVSTSKPAVMYSTGQQFQRRQFNITSPQSSQSSMRATNVNKRFSRHLQDLEQQLGLKNNQNPTFPSMAKIGSKIMQKQARIDFLKKEVNNYIQAAKTNYKIDIYKPPEVKTQLKPATFDFEPDAARRSVLNSTTNQFRSMAQLPKIEESIQENLTRRQHQDAKQFKSKSSYDHRHNTHQQEIVPGDHLPQFVVDKLRIHKMSTKQFPQDSRMTNSNSEKFKASFYHYHDSLLQNSQLRFIKNQRSSPSNKLYHSEIEDPSMRNETKMKSQPQDGPVIIKGVKLQRH